MTLGKGRVSSTGVILSNINEFDEFHDLGSVLEGWAWPCHRPFQAVARVLQETRSGGPYEADVAMHCHGPKGGCLHASVKTEPKMRG